MFFDPRTGLGGAADLSGKISSSTGNRDTLAVKPFICQKM
jgi:hypothetical protein